MLKDAYHQLLQYYMVTLIPFLRVFLATLLLWDIHIAVTTHFFFSYHFHSTERNCPEKCRQSPLLPIPAGPPKGIVPGHRALQYTWWKNALQCLPSNTTNYYQGNNTTLGFSAFLSHNSMNFPLSCFSALYIHRLSLRRMKPFLTTLFLGHEGTFHSNNNVLLYSPSGRLPEYRISFYR